MCGVCLGSDLGVIMYVCGVRRFMQSNEDIHEFQPLPYTVPVPSIEDGHRSSDIGNDLK